MSKNRFQTDVFITIIIIGILVGLRFTLESAFAAPKVVSWPNIEIVPHKSGFSSPVHITNADDSTNRLFVVERGGTIRIIKDGSLLSTPFLDIRERVQSTGGEEGLLSLAFPPDYSSRGHFYIYYTNKNGDNQVSRFYVSDNMDIADTISEELILYLEHPFYANHNGGQLAFGPDGYLYIATGDGGGGGDPLDNAQNPDSLLGKILRIDVEILPAILKRNTSNVVYLPLVTGGNGTIVEKLYQIPPDNPFMDDPEFRDEIWALGLRNPWRFSFDRGAGDLYIGDVGQGSWEEVDFQPNTSLGGENYGWNEMEGSNCYLPNCDMTGMTKPVYEYPTHVNNTCAVTGGIVYRGTTYPSLQGIYIFGDYCNGEIYGLQRDGESWEDQPLIDADVLISSFGEDEAGELYLADLKSGTIFKIEVPTD